MQKTLILSCFLLLLFYNNANSQSRRDSINLKRDSAKLLTPKALNLVLNKALGNVASGQETGTSLANHAAFDPSAGSFLLNGYVPIFYNNDSAAKRISFLNFKIAAGLINGNAAKLFENTKLNSDVSIDLKYNFSLGWRGISYIETEKIKLHTQLAILETQRKSDSNKVLVSYDSATLLTKIWSFDWSITVLKSNRETIQKKLDSVMAKASGFSGPPQVLDSLNKLYADSASKLIAALDKVKNDISDSEFKKDSIQQVVKNNVTLAKARNRESEKIYAQRKNDLILAAKLTSIHFGWFSAGFVLNKKTYFNFTDTAAFDNQIVKGELDAFNISLEYNYYHQWIDRNRILYLNAGLITRKYNNLTELTTTTVNQTRTITNTAGDIQRTITKKYDAYTEPVEEFRSVLLYANVYYFIGKRAPLGFHLFPEVDFQSNKKNPMNIGIGGILALKDEKKDKNILNIEAYLKFKDVGNALDSEDKFYKRILVGIRVGLPIKLII
jgi:hypothetical protein